MRRKYLVIGFALVSLGAAAAVAILPPSSDGTGNLPFVPADSWSVSGNRQAPPSGTPGAPPQNSPTHQQSDPVDAIDLPFDGKKIYVADLSDDALADDPASEPVGGEGQTAKGGKSTNTETTKGTTTDDPFGSIQDNGFSTAGGSGRFAKFASSGNPSDQSTASDNGGLGDNGSSGGSGGTGESSNGGSPTDDGRTDDVVKTDDSETSVTIDEPAPVFLLLIGGLALVLARRRAKHRAAR